MPYLSVIILNYNARDYLKKCLSSIRNSVLGRVNLEVLVADNGSSDGSLDMVRKYFPEVAIIDNKKNIGFAAGNNRAITKSKGQFLLFLNPDTILEKNTLAQMISFVKRKRALGAATCRVELPDGTLDESCHRGFPTPWNSFCHFSGLEKLFPRSRFFAGYTLSYKSEDKVHQIDSAGGAFLMVKRQAGEQINWWDEDYFFYGEDLDFCYRLLHKDWKVFYYPHTKIIHYRGISSGIKKHSTKISTSDKLTRLKSAIASTEAMSIFYRKHYLRKYPFYLTWLVNFGIFIIKQIRTRKIK